MRNLKILRCTPAAAHEHQAILRLPLYGGRIKLSVFQTLAFQIFIRL
jgi:hypothetical protein